MRLSIISELVSLCSTRRHHCSARREEKSELSSQAALESTHQAAQRSLAPQAPQARLGGRRTGVRERRAPSLPSAAEPEDKELRRQEALLNGLEVTTDDGQLGLQRCARNGRAALCARASMIDYSYLAVARPLRALPKVN